MDILTNPTFLDRTNLVGEWLLDGDATDTGGSNNGTATNVTWVASERGYTSEVGDFNGSSSYVSLGNNIFTSAELSDFTISYWMKLDTISGDRSFDFEARILNQINADGTLEFRIFDGSTYDTISTSAGEISTGEWYHIVNTRNSTQSELFINNVSKGTFASAGPVELDAVSREWRIGSYFSGGNWFDGKIGLFKIYDVALSQTEREDLYQEGLRRFGPTNLLFNNTDFSKYSLANLRDGLVLDISKAQYTTNTYADQSGNGNTGTATSVTDTALGLNNVMTFNGSSSYINISSVLFSATEGMTIEAWVRNEVINASEYIFSQWGSSYANGYLLRFNVGGEVVFLARNAAGTNQKFTLTSTKLVSTNTWYHVVATWDGTTASNAVRLYVNSELWAKGTSTETSGTPSGSETGGSVWGRISAAGTSNYWDGDMLSCKTYTRGLSEEEVQQNYKSNFITN